MRGNWTPSKHKNMSMINIRNKKAKWVAHNTFTKILMSQPSDKENKLGSFVSTKNEMKIVYLGGTWVIDASMSSKIVEAGHVHKSG